MSTSLAEHVDALYSAVERAGPDAFQAALEGIVEATQRSEPAEVSAALERLEPMLARIPLGMGPDLAQVAGAMTDFGGDPASVLATLVERAAGAMEQAARFAELHRAAGLALPDPGDFDAVGETRDRFTAAVQVRGLAGEEEAEDLLQAWYCGDSWVQPVLFMNQRRDVRRALPQRARLLNGVRATREYLGTAGWLEGLLLVLDDEPLIVLDRGFAGTGRGFRVTIGGIGDNFQLHTMLAAALIGHHLPGRAPAPAEVAAATDGPDLTPEGGIRGSWNLVDHGGKWIWNEGRPSDIPHLDGVRVVVLEPEPYQRSWNAGRAYPHMAPLLRIDEPLSPQEAAAWLSRCTTSS
ncbi:hypothetical protein ACFFX1_43235 [Dactylosporangium sucinum]|uniref:Uncharacterized protein n=1 Tax=Dactylosporangium sucinum TaxID=1424081 RepID=A0A917WYD9_9ACTN|nr:hypothetical protein [Dactylosporangium sucinum]GGM45353.1 hypothetical protein GCM10007977_053640 [Dactylosporangium sucinum]